MVDGGFGIIFSNITNITQSLPSINNNNLLDVFSDSDLKILKHKMEWKYKALLNMDIDIPSPPLRVYVTLINNAGNNEVIGPFLIYQMPLSEFEVDYMECDVAYVSVGYICLLNLKNSMNQVYWIKLSF